MYEWLKKNIDCLKLQLFAFELAITNGKSKAENCGETKYFFTGYCDYLAILDQRNEDH